MALWGVPRVPHESVVRPRIEALIDARPLTVLRAPAGFGKTVAMAQWASRPQKRGVWLKVREPGAEAAGFVVDLSRELIAAGFSPADSELGRITDVLQAGVDPWDVLRRALHAADPLTLAIDQSDNLSDTTARKLLELLIDVPSVRVVATTRRMTPLADPAASIVVERTSIGMEALGMTPEEAAALLRADAESEVVSTVIRSGGSPLVARALRVSRVAGTGSPALSAERIIDSTLENSIRSGAWSDEFVHLLLSISVADSVTIHLAAELSGQDVGGAERILNLAESEGLGLWSDDSLESEFALTPLVARALTLRLQRTDARRVPDLRRRVAEWSLHHGRPFIALKNCVAIAEWGLATDVVRAYWSELLSQHPRQVRALFAPVSALTLRHYPLITMLLALLYNARGAHRLRALEYFAITAHAARNHRPTTSIADRALLKAIESAALRVSGKGECAAAAARHGRELVLTMSEEDHDSLGRNEPTVHNQFGTTFFYAGETELALESFARSTAVSDTRGLKGGLQGLALSAGTSALTGDLVAARRFILDAHTRSWPEGWMTGYPGSFLQVAEAISALERFDARTAQHHLDALAPHRETIEHWPALLFIESKIALLQHRADEGLERFDETLRRQQRRNAMSTYSLLMLQGTRATLTIALGDLDGANRTIAQGRRRIPRAPAVSARIALARGDAPEALRLLLDEDPRTRSSLRVDAEAQLLRAAALAIVRPDPTTSIRAVQRMLASGQQLAAALVPVSALETMIDGLRSADPTEDSIAAIDVLRKAADLAVIDVSDIRPRLTPRERVVARELARQPSVAAIAEALTVSPNTVKSQVRALYAKLGVTTKEDALAVLSRHRIIDPPEASPNASSGG